MAGEAFGTTCSLSWKGKDGFGGCGRGRADLFRHHGGGEHGCDARHHHGVAKVAEKLGVDEAPAEILGFLTSIGLGSFIPAQTRLQKMDLKIQDFSRKSAPGRGFE